MAAIKSRFIWNDDNVEVEVDDDADAEAAAAATIENKTADELLVTSLIVEYEIEWKGKERKGATSWLPSSDR